VTWNLGLAVPANFWQLLRIALGTRKGSGGLRPAEKINATAGRTRRASLSTAERTLKGQTTDKNEKAINEGMPPWEGAEAGRKETRARATDGWTANPSRFQPASQLDGGMSARQSFAHTIVVGNRARLSPHQLCAAPPAPLLLPCHSGPPVAGKKTS
jgi:hypothetical protein